MVESGLGGTPKNFEMLNFRTLPNSRSIDELWPDLSVEDMKKCQDRQSREAQDNGSCSFSGLDMCGRFEFAGKAIAVALAGAAAGCFAIAEVRRFFHGGLAISDTELRLETRHAMLAKTWQQQLWPK